MARPTKYNPERGDRLCGLLRQGCTRKASAESCGVSYASLLRWIESYASFATDVTRAESEAEALYTAAVQKAAFGYDAGTTTRHTKTIVKTKKTTLPDGSIVEEPVLLTVVSETQYIAQEFDWRAAESWLKRRRKEEWGDSADITSGGEPIKGYLGFDTEAV